VSLLLIKVVKGGYRWLADADAVQVQLEMFLRSISVSLRGRLA
jgi:hypothetical protein